MLEMFEDLVWFVIFLVRMSTRSGTYQRRSTHYDKRRSGKFGQMHSPNSLGKPFSKISLVYSCKQALLSNLSNLTLLLLLCCCDTQIFITLIDKLKLGIKANDELQPDVRELIDNMNRLSILPNDFEGKLKIQKWFTLLRAMNASEEIDDEQARNFSLDLENALYAFNNSV